MHFQTLVIYILLFSTASFAVGRSPAVEDFVGIEFQEEQVAPQGTESLFNLEQDINKIEANKKTSPKVSDKRVSGATKWGLSAVFGISGALALPMIIWFLMMAHLKKKASIESATNIEVLEKYRRDREKKNQETIRKVS